jgi:hypothetical protein
VIAVRCIHNLIVFCVELKIIALTIPSRLGFSTSGYEEHTWTEDYFDSHVLSQPRVICAKSKVAELCGLHMKIYFHEYAHQEHVHRLHAPPTVGITDEEKEMWPRNIINKGATLLVFDPCSGFCDYRILGKAYVVVDGGDYPLSNHQVWGLQELISEARDIYHCDPEHNQRGYHELLRFVREYRHQNYGPLTIYTPRVVSWMIGDPSETWSTKTTYNPEDHIHHNHHQSKSDKTLYRHMDHSYGKYGRVRFVARPVDEELLVGNTDPVKQNDIQSSGRRIPNIFTACHVLD